MSESKIWFIVLTYRPKLKSLIIHLQVFKEFPYVLVDNSEIFNEYPKKIKVVRTGKNLGYTGGMNRGISYCLSHGADWVIVLNQDVQISKKGITQFCKALQKCDPRIVGPEAGSLDSRRWTTMLASRPGLEAGSRVDYISGSMMAIHREVWEKIGGFYEPYFMYYEDADLCMRAKNLGFPLLQVKVDGFLHEPGKSLGKEYYLARNHLLFAKRLAPILVKIHELLRLPKTLMEHNQMENSEAIRGIGDFMAGRFGKGIT